MPVSINRSDAPSEEMDRLEFPSFFNSDSGAQTHGHPYYVRLAYRTLP